MENKTVPWNERAEVEWLQYTAQPPAGLVKGEYFCARRRFGATPWSEGHLGELAAVRGDDGALIYVEFNETTTEGYYNRYFDGVDKRRSDYSMWQASTERQAKAGVVLVDGMLHVERQMLQRQSLAGEFDLLTGASNSVKGLLPLAGELDAQMQAPSPERYYGLAKDFGYGITGWLQVILREGKIIRCHYDEVFADHQKDIRYPALKKYYRQSKYHSPCFEEPPAPGWPARPSYTGFKKLMDLLDAQVVETQDLTGLTGLPHTDGTDRGPLWDRASEDEAPLPPFEFGKTTVRYPVWDNYLALAKVIQAEILADGCIKGG